MSQKETGEVIKSASLESDLSDLSDLRKEATVVQAAEPKSRKASAGKCEIIGLVLCTILDPQILYGELHTHYLTGSTDLGYVVFVFLLVMPTIFVQLFMGQYTQLSCLHLGRMVPILHGVGIVMMILNFYTIVLVLENSDLCLHYFFMSLNEPWKSCATEPQVTNCEPFKGVLSCVGDDCPTAPYDQLSGYVYFRNIRKTRKPEMIVYMVLLVALSCFVTILGYRRYRSLVRINLVSVTVITMVLIFTVLTLTNNPKATNASLRKAALSITRTNMSSMSEDIPRGLINMQAGTATYFVYGTFLPPTHKANITSFAICLTYFLFTAFGALLLRLCYYSILFSAGWTGEYRISAMEAVYVVVPEYLGSLHVAPIFVIGFYWCCFILILTKLVMHIEIINETIIGYFKTMEDYRIYLVICVSVLAILCTIPYMLIGNGLVPDLLNSAKEYSTLFLLEIEFAVIMYIYSYAIFSDDIHFAYGSQPATLWKVMWVIFPLWIFVLLVIYNHQTKNFLAFLLLVLFTLLPILIGALYKLVKTIQAQNALNFLMPDESWGMEDPFMCKLRKIYNPRDEIRAQRKVDECKHECLIGSEVLSSMIKTEIDINLTVKMEKRVPRTDDVIGDVEGVQDSLSSEAGEAGRRRSSLTNAKEDVDRFYEELLQKYGIELE